MEGRSDSKDVLIRTHLNFYAPPSLVNAKGEINKKIKRELWKSEMGIFGI